MTDAVWIKLIENVPLTLGAVSGTFLAFQTWRTKQATKAGLAKTEEVHEEAKAIKADAKVIKHQTDGQFDKMRAEIKSLHDELTTVYRENAALRSILSAREEKPAGEAVRRDDAISTATGPPSGNGDAVHRRRRRSDPKA
jgi:uncharacterized protein YdeI (YjbR/CyaY-like superfamily)